MKKIAILTAAVMMAFGSSAFAASKAQAEKAIAEANAANDAAKKMGFEWRDVRWKKAKKPLIGQAEKALAKKDYKTAVKLANKAKAHGDLAVAQAKSQAKAGPSF